MSRIREGPSKSSKAKKKGLGPVLAEMVHGQFERDSRLVTSPLTTSAAVEQEISGPADNWCGTSVQARVYPWMRYTFAWGDTNTSYAGYVVELFLLKSKKTDALEDMSDSAVNEAKMRAGEVFYHKLFTVPAVSAGASMPFYSVEFRNVRLMADEELRGVLLPHYTTTTGRFPYLMEWRVPSLA